jgi:hypothetical protein
MKNTHPIFRADAVRRYIEGQQRAVLPRFVCPRTFLYLWILLGLLLLTGGFVTWFARGSLLLGEGNTQPGVSSGLERSLPLRSPMSQRGENCG